LFTQRSEQDRMSNYDTHLLCCNITTSQCRFLGVSYFPWCTRCTTASEVLNGRQHVRGMISHEGTRLWLRECGIADMTGPRFDFVTRRHHVALTALHRRYIDIALMTKGRSVALSRLKSETARRRANDTERTILLKVSKSIVSYRFKNNFMWSSK